ncbi:hypothetical protein [Nocardiopsis trehalosi]|jgi:hypothetical protein|uniref:hypothetical protein n=1 Tax=Nocardiopsis trehalosi TaxID=109329 RepID=UPI000830BEC7|nr:hypothetical protein [Nocardiopsis trehalosi]
MNLKKLLLVAGVSAAALFGAAPAFAESEVPAPPAAEQPAPETPADPPTADEAAEQERLDEEIAREQEALEEAGLADPLAVEPNYTG